MTLETVMQEASEKQSQKSLFENNIVLVVSFSAWGLNRKADINKIETPANKAELKLQKKLLKSKAYDRIVKNRMKIKELLKAYSAPSPAIRPSAHLIRLEYVKLVDDKLQKLIADEQPLLDAFEAEYESAIAQAAIDLSDQFKASQYPPFEQVRKEFGINVSYMTFSTPEALKQIKASIFQRETEKMQLKIQEVTQNIETLLVSEFQSLIDNALKNLRPELVEGKRQVFRTEWSEKICQLVDSLRARNLTENADLYALGEKVKAVMNNMDVEGLKKNPDWRKEAAAQFDELKSVMTTMLVAKPSREIYFE